MGRVRIAVPEKRRMTSGKRARQRRSGNSRLGDHKQQGKRLTAPINAIAQPALLPWLRDVFPSLIWPSAVLHEHGLDKGLIVAARVLDILADFVPDSVVLDGSLQSFESVPEGKRAEALQSLRRAGSLYEEGFPWLLVRALDRYEGMPGAWVFGGWAGARPVVAEEAPGEFLADVVRAAWHGRTDVATRAKVLAMRGQIYAGRVQLAPGLGFVELLPRYPNRLDDDERARVESSIRAMFNALWGMQESPEGEARQAWAASFWRRNWSLYPCTVLVPDTDRIAEPGDAANGRPPWADARADALRRVEALKERFQECAFAVDPDVYSPDRHEVLTGLVNRQVRAVEAMASMPLFWSVEHGAPLIRGLVEARIIAKWLMHQHDRALYERFKDYGRGHLKLHVLHLREYADAETGNTSDLDAEIAELEQILERDMMEEFQDIDVNARFTKEDTRTMAYAVGLDREYRTLFAPMSANVHGEWITLDQYALDVCRNPLHRAHRLPNFDTRTMLNPTHVTLALDQLEAMVDEYVGGIDISA